MSGGEILKTQRKSPERGHIAPSPHTSPTALAEQGMRLGSWEGGERPSTQRLRVGRGLHSLGPCAMPGASSFLGPEAENGCLQIAGTGRRRWDGCWSARNVTTMSTGWRGLGPSRHPGSGRHRRWAPDVGPGAHDSPRVLGDGHTRGSATAESKHPQRCPAAVGFALGR